jgi:hypothetical protein
VGGDSGWALFHPATPTAARLQRGRRQMILKMLSGVRVLGLRWNNTKDFQIIAKEIGLREPEAIGSSYFRRVKLRLVI